MDSYIGRRVRYDVINSNRVTLIRERTILNSDHINLIKNHNIDLNTIMFISKDEDQCIKSVKQVVDRSKELFNNINFTKKIPLMEIRTDILPIVNEISENTNIFQLLQSVKATDEYTYQHNIGVGILSTLIGKWLKLSATEMATLSLAAILHDVGKIRIPLEVLNKPGKLTDDEFKLIKKHTIYGYELLKDTVGLNQRIPIVALQHHERSDGTGYPFGLKQDKIYHFSKIVAVADIFHAMSSKRPYHNPIPHHEIINQMRKGIYGDLDPVIVSVFLDNITTRMVGENVVLTDGRIGEVVSLNPHNIETPLVKIFDQFVDLSKEHNLQIKDISV